MQRFTRHCQRVRPAVLISGLPCLSAAADGAPAVHLTAIRGDPGRQRGTLHRRPGHPVLRLRYHAAADPVDLRFAVAQ